MASITQAPPAVALQKKQPESMPKTPQRFSLATHRWLQQVHVDAEHDHDGYEIAKPGEQEKVSVVGLSFWAQLLLTSIGAGLASFMIDEFCFYFLQFRILEMSQLAGHGGVVLAILMNTTIVVIARRIVRATPESEGSGIPEVKAQLFGKELRNFFSLRVFVVKSIGLALMLASGVPVGKEGPFVHIAACVASVVEPSALHQGSAHVMSLLLAAVAIAVGTTFSAPLSGVIFALELMLPQVYDLTTYWGCFAASIAASIFWSGLRAVTSGSALLPMISSNVQANEGLPVRFAVPFLLVYMLLGVICGVMGCIFIESHQWLSKRFKRWRTVAMEASSAGRHMLEKRNTLSKFAEYSGPANKRVSWQSDQTRSLLDNATSGSLEDGEVERSTSAIGTLVRRATTSVSSFATKIRESSFFEWRDLFQVGAAAVVNTILVSQIPLLVNKNIPILLSALFDKTFWYNEDPLNPCGLWRIDAIGPTATLVVAFLCRWFMVVWGVSLPIPAGVIGPSMVLGAFIGRLYACCLPAWLEDLVLSAGAGAVVTDEMRGALHARFAMIGAGAFASAVCRAFSMAITIFEVLALSNSVLPVGLASLTAIFVANEICPSFFDQILINKNMGGISASSSTHKAMSPVAQIMRKLDPHLECLEQHCTLSDIEHYLNNLKQSREGVPKGQIVEHTVPIVHHTLALHEAILVGSMKEEGLEQLYQNLKVVKDDQERVHDLLDPELDMGLARGGKTKIRVNRMPLHVRPTTPVKDAYLLLKVVYHERAIFVTESAGKLLGIITNKELSDTKHPYS